MSAATFTLEGGVARLTAPSLRAYVEACPAAYRRFDVDPDWQGADSYDHARHMALHGSHLHREMMAKGVVAAKRAREPYRRPARRWDVAGERECPGRAAAGDPACMLRRAPRRDAPRPIERWLVHQGGLANVSASIRVARGAALLALLDNVESQGVRVEVELVLAASDPSASCTHWESRIMVKLAEEALNLDVLAFSLVCPAIHRWLDFSLRADRVGSFGMGKTVDIPPESRDGQIYFPAIRDDSSWLVPETAARRVTEQHAGG